MYRSSRSFISVHILCPCTSPGTQTHENSQIAACSTTAETFPYYPDLGRCRAKLSRSFSAQSIQIRENDLHSDLICPTYAVIYYEYDIPGIILILRVVNSTGGAEHEKNMWYSLRIKRNNKQAVLSSSSSSTLILVNMTCWRTNIITYARTGV